MLNRAARFFPILRELKLNLPDEGSLLEVGSGSLGLGEFCSIQFVGCDIDFQSPPVRNMRAVRCSGHRLPFPDKSFDAVVASDVMEHILPEQRAQVIGEVLRVARIVAIFGYPCGLSAFELDRQLYAEYKSRKQQPPVWLEEHMFHMFPDEDLFAVLPQGWVKKVVPNESLGFHNWMMRAEMSRVQNLALRIALKVLPGLVERWLRQVNSEPSYRKIFVLTRGGS